MIQVLYLKKLIEMNKRHLMTTEMLLITSPSFIRAYHILFERNRS